MRRLALVALLLTLARSVAAEPTESDKEAARILFTEAKELRDAGKLLPALERFRRAHDLAATPITTVELARTHALLGHLVEARRLYRSIDALEKKPGESAKATAAREEAKELATALDVKIPTLVIQVTGGENATATLDGAAVEIGPPIAVDPGKHQLIARAKTEAKVEVTVAEGERDRVVSLVLPAEAVVVPPGVVVVPPPRPVERSTWPTTVRWVGGVTAGVGLVVGAGAGVLALSAASGVRESCTGGVCPPSSHDDLDATRRWATISTIGFGVAVVGATLLVIGFSSEPSKKDVAALSVVPYASLGGFGFTGSF